MAGNQRNSSNGGQMNGLPGTRAVAGRTSGPNEFTELADVERFTDAYLEQLMAEEVELQKELDIELQIQEDLKKLRYEHESKIAVTKDKIADLGIPALEKNIEELKQSIEQAKLTHDEISRECIEKSREMRMDIERFCVHFDTQRKEFKSPQAIMNGLKTKQVQAEQQQRKVQEIQAQISELDRKLARPVELINLDHVRLILRGVEDEIEAADKRLEKFKEVQTPKPSPQP